MKYRPEIDGLRTLAVVPVVLFHAGIPPFTGGFVGVDIFFVISGYLISKIILDEANENGFSILRFYERRARRILPTLFLVMLCCIPPAWTMMNGPQIEDFGQSLTATAIFLSNVLFWKESGYFEQAAELKPLLHTWSLAVEEQFYLIYPFLAALLVKRSRFILYATLVIGILSSLVLAQAGVRSSPSTAFYLLPSRIWELLVGALFSALPPPKSSSKNNILSGIGMLAIIASILAYDRNTPFPGLAAVPPTLGTALILRYATSGTIANRILSFSPFVSIGLISYSFYLWHQPVFAFARIYAGEHPPALIMILLSLLALGMAWVTWRYVETPFRHGKVRFFITRQGVFASSGVGLAAIAGLGAILSATDLTKIRYNRSLIGNLADVTNVYEFFDYNAVVRNKVCHSVDEESFRKNGCLDKRQKNILLWGDSYAAALYPGLEFYRNEKYQNVGITQLTDGNGPPFLRSDRTIDGGVRTLEEANTFRLKVAQDIQPDLIILTWYIGGSGSYGTPADDAKALEQLISRIRSFAPKARMVIVGPVPRWQGSLLKQVVGYSIARKQIPPQYISMGLGESEPVWDSFLKSYAWGKNVTYVSALSEMCRPDGTCLAHASDDVADLSAIDWGHLTRSGSVFLIGRLEAILFK